MYICKVKEKCVSTIKNDGLKSYSLLILEKEDAKGKPSDNTLVAVDPLGCSIGERVIVTTGASARLALGDSNLPVDATIVGIVDNNQ